MNTNRRNLQTKLEEAMKSKWFSALSLTLIMVLLLTACAQATPTAVEAPTSAPAPTEAPAGMAVDCMGASAGDQLSVMYQWSGAEEEKINTIFKPFIDACGVPIVAETTRDAAVLDTKAKST